jgi:hypothetical protein
LCTMRRWILRCTLVILVAFVYASYWQLRETRARHQREAAYQSVLRSYQAALARGAPRELVEKYLESQAVHFERSCCNNPEYAASDLAKIGDEPAPWYCSHNFVYIEFQFSTGANNSIHSDSSDRLKKVALYQKLEDCL